MTAKIVNLCIWGGTGDLSKRKLLPAIASLLETGQLSEKSALAGLGRRELTDQAYRAFIADALTDVKDERIRTLIDNARYFSIADQSGYVALKQYLDNKDLENGQAVDRVYYLAMPPDAFKIAVENIGNVGLNDNPSKIRLVVEKPFGTDYDSAKKLNAFLHRYFDESSIYRIDHYLGKDTVQNLLVLRFANTIFESLWNRDKIASVEIMVAEKLGLENRAGYYDNIGAVKDMLQNHLIQLLTFIAMEVPAKINAESIRNEKIKILHSVLPILKKDVVLAQYGQAETDGKIYPAYKDETGVAPDSKTETFASVKLCIDNWRWQGVPFILTTGKRMPKQLTRISVHFKSAPVCMFRSVDICQISSNTLNITLQPNEGFTLLIDVKAPGSLSELRQIPLQFDYSSLGETFSDAYKTLLLEIINGDQTLFVHSDEVELSWKIFDQIPKLKADVLTYDSFAWGPPEACVSSKIKL